MQTKNKENLYRGAQMDSSSGFDLFVSDAGSLGDLFFL